LASGPLLGGVVRWRVAVWLGDGRVAEYVYVRARICTKEGAGMGKLTDGWMNGLKD